MIGVLLCWVGLQLPPDSTLPFAPRPVVDTLCSKAFFGRGYQRGGAAKAAEYLSRRMAGAGVAPGAGGGSYMQPFRFPLNRIDAEPTLRVAGKKLRLGQDFLPDASTPSAHLHLKAWRYDSLAWSTLSERERKGLALVFKSAKQRARFEKTKEPKPLLALVCHTQLPAHTLEAEAAPYPTLHITDSAAPQPGAPVRYAVASVAGEASTANVVGMVRGTVQPDSFLIVGAHYDHLGGFGKRVYFPGANDNASGTTLLLELATAIARQPLRYTVVFVAFSGEEAGLQGSSYFVQHSPIPLERVRFMLNLDLIGSGEEGATGVNAPAVQPDFDQLLLVNRRLATPLPALRGRRNAPNSDHYPFAQAGVPALFLYLQGPYTFYHSIQDRPRPELTLAGFEQTYRLCRGFLAQLAGNREL